MADEEDDKKRVQRPRQGAPARKPVDSAAEQDAIPQPPIAGRLVALAALLALLVGLGAFAWNALHGQPLDDIAKGAAVNVGQRLAAARDHGGQAVLKEGELNGFLAATLDARQGGALSGMAKVRRVLVRLQPQVAEVIIERELLGTSQTVSLFVRMVPAANNPGALEVTLDGGKLLGGVPAGGRFGQVRMPQGFVRMVLGSFGQLTEVYAPELALLGLTTTPARGRPRPHMTIDEGVLRVDYRR